MTTVSSEIIQKICTLPKLEQIEILENLVNRLNPSTPIAEEVALAISIQRAKDYRNGRANLKSHDEIFDAARSALQCK